jgi:hypothetical protein
MSRKNRDKGRMAPFVPLYRLTKKQPAWLALSTGARMVYLELMANYNTRMENHVYLAARKGAELMGCDKKSIPRWLKELQHYGFIVMVEPGCLGVEGHGHAPTWRLTEMPYAGAAPTWEFMNWDGVLFESKKQNPVPLVGSPRTAGGDKRTGAKMVNPRPKRTAGGDKGMHPGCTAEGDITTSTTTMPSSTPSLVSWTTPLLTEMPYTPDLRQLYATELAMAA